MVRFVTVAAIAVAFTASTAIPADAQTRISRGRIAEETGFTLTPVAENLSYPWSVTWLPNGDAVISERPGQLRIVRDGALVDTAIAFPAEVTSGGDGGITRGQGGLMDVVAHPDFENTPYLYFSYSAGDEEANRTTIARARLSGDTLEDFEVLYENPDAKGSGQHFGSRIEFLDDGTFLASIGDGGNPPIMFEGEEIRRQAQQLDTVFGKVIRLNADGSVPDDNPFAGQDNVRPEIFSYGHRNIQGLAQDPQTGALWANEHGAAAGDELNRIEAGVNYGWPAVTYARNYRDGSLISDRTTDPDMRDPAVVWLDTHAPSGLAIYRGEEFADWDGRALSGGLITQDVRVIDVSADPRPTESRIPVGERVRDVRQGPDGKIYILTDGEQGRMLRMDAMEANED